MRRIILIFFLLLSLASNSQQHYKSRKEALVLGEQIQLYSSQLNEERTLNIYLPEGYNKKDSNHYPVIYVLDGGIDEDLLSVIAQVHYNSLPWVNNMSKSIIVGIVNTNRKRDFTSKSSVKSNMDCCPAAGGSSKFIAFIEKDLMHFINTNYKTLQNNTLIGQSFGALLATEILFTKPEMFKNYILISPSLWWNDAYWLKTKSGILDATKASPIAVFIGVGKEGLAPCSEGHVMELEANLLADKLKQSCNKSIKVSFEYYPNENHATIYPKALNDALKVLYLSPK